MIPLALLDFLLENESSKIILDPHFPKKVIFTILWDGNNNNNNDET